MNNNSAAEILYNKDSTGAENLRGNPQDNMFLIENGMGPDMSYSYFAENHSELGGLKSFFARNAARRRAKDKQKAINDAAKNANKNLEAQAQLASANNLGALANMPDSSAALANALSSGGAGSGAGAATKTSHTGLYIGIGVGVLILAGVAYYFIKKKKKLAAK